MVDIIIACHCSHASLPHVHSICVPTTDHTFVHSICVPTTAHTFVHSICVPTTGHTFVHSICVPTTGHTFVHSICVPTTGHTFVHSICVPTTGHTFVHSICVPTTGHSFVRESTPRKSQPPLSLPEEQRTTKRQSSFPPSLSPVKTLDRSSSLDSSILSSDSYSE